MINTESIDSFIKRNEDNIFRDIARLVAVNSVKSEPLPGAPFGIGPKAALDTALLIAGEMGLKTFNCDNKVGYAEISGDKEEYISTVTHVDCVDVNDGWTADPFTMRERDGWIIGRGVQDDKGPSVICLYALKYLQEAGVPLRYSVRAIMGADEENGMGDIEYYLKNYPAPLFCFSPDADFPLVNGEKGIVRGSMTAKAAPVNVADIKGGFAVNVIPDKAEAWIKAENLQSADKVTAVKEGELWHLTATGIPGHASAPEGTDNAIGNLVDYILDNNIVSGGEKEYFDFLRAFHSDAHGNGVGAYAKDDVFGEITIVGGIIGMKNGRIVSSFDSRYPTSTDAGKIAAALAEKAGEAAEIAIEADSVPFYMSPDNPAVKCCINTYNEVTGENAAPFTIGGGTYARDFPNGVSFGPEHPERPMPDFAGPIHGVDEAACKDWLLEALKIYIITLIKLQELDF